VADESRAVIFQRKGRRTPLDELMRLQNETARMKSGDLLADRDGRSFDSHGQGRHAVEKENADPKRQAALVFAKDLAVRIVKAGHKDDFDELVLIAAPRFLGLLRDALATAGKITPFLTIAKDVVQHDAEFIRDLIRTHEEAG
jgi:protein required for attachment to host cells